MSFTFSQPGAEIFIPDGAPETQALARVKSLIVGAHQDDVEFMGFPLIRDAYGTGEPSLGAVVMSNGAGSPRAGVYADCTDEQMQAIRRQEQRLAAQVGRYAAMVQLRFTSKALRNPADPAPAAELGAIPDAVLVRDDGVHPVTGTPDVVRPPETDPDVLTRIVELDKSLGR